MTEPEPVMAQAEQDQLTRQVGRALLTVAGADWQQIRAEYRSAGRHIEVDVLVKGPDGIERTVRPPQEVVDGFGRLRQGMYRPGRGTWLSALYLLDPPSSFSAEFEPDVEPRWRRVPPPIGFADELRFFPRGDEHIPDWLRLRAGLPPAPGAAVEQSAATGPSGPSGPPAGAGTAGPGPGGVHDPGGAAPPGPGGPHGPGMRPGPPARPGVPAGPGGLPTRTPGGSPMGRPPAPGLPSTPFGGREGAPPSPPRGFDASPPEPTPPTGIPAGPYAGNESAHTPPRGDSYGQNSGWGPPR